MVYSRDLPKMAVMDDQGLSWTILNNPGLAWTGLDIALYRELDYND